MRYHYEKPKAWSQNFGEIYACDHPLYSSCTLYRTGETGLAVVQYRWSPKMKIARLGPIDPWLVDQIYVNPMFREYFLKHSGEKSPDGLFPTVFLRKLMYALRMKPIRYTPIEKFLSPK